MARWIPLSIFKELYTDQSALLTAEGNLQFLERIQGSEGATIAEKWKLGIADFRFFVESLKNQETIVFHGWVAQDKVLSETLESGKISGEYTDKQGYLKHTLATKFQKFITPYLTDLLLTSEGSKAELRELFSFATLLEPDTRPTVEAHLFKPIAAKLNLLKEIRVLRKEQELIQVVTPLCSDGYLACVNYLSKRSYALKLQYIDAILETIRTPACTVRLANWILKQMEQLVLNNEHQAKIVELRNELASGNLRVKQLETITTPARWKPIVTIFTVVGLIAIALIFLVFKPFSKAEVYDGKDSAGFEEFSEQEQKEIDSMVFAMQKDEFMEGREIDPNIIIQSSQQIQLRQPYRNSLMEQIYADLSKDATLQENYFEDSCPKKVAYTHYSGVQDLKGRKAEKEVQFRNESEYDLIVYVCSNDVLGDVFAMYVTPKQTVSFQMDEYDIVMTLAGKHFVPFRPPVGSTAIELPSLNFTHHFCKTDHNYFQSFSTALRLKVTKRKTIKFLVTGSSSGEFQLVDVYDVAEAY